MDCSLIDVCLGCYLTDHHNRDGELLLGVPVYRDTTYSEVLEGLRSELQACDYGLPDSFDWDACDAAMVECFANATMSDKFDSSLDEQDDDGESCQAWFLITYGEEEEC